MAATVDDTFYRPDNPFMDRLIDSVYRRRGHKRQRSASHSKDADLDAMPLFATTNSRQHLAPPSNLVRKRSERNLASRHDVDDYLTSDELEVSFASNVSLNSPPRRPSGLPDCEPMDISPMPPPKSKGTSGLRGAGRPRAFTSNNSRLFGSDLSNGSNPAHLTTKSADATEPKKAGTTTNRKLTRGTLPTEWMAAMLPPQPEPEQAPTQPSSPIDDAMDVDTSYIMEAPPAIAAVDFSSPVQPAPPGQDGFTNLFYDTMSPCRSLDDSKGGSKKQRSLSPEGSPAMVNDATSSPAPPSPSVEKFDRMAAAGRSLKPGLQGLGAPSVSFLRRPRRPVLSEVVVTAGHEIQSAYPIPSAGLQAEGSGPGGLPVRRAFSALLPPSAFTMESEGDSSFDAEEPDMSSPAQAYHKRQQGKTIRRRDGTEDFRPLTGASTAAMRASPSSRVRSPGLPGFGDNEAHGKILPCHRVSEDGLMRITPRTVNELLDGKFDHAINDFHIIDCRFDYEYAGGHIKNAVNINTTAAIEELLLGPSLTKPRPSTSGDNTRKTLLVFHCEFSAKRAPTFAKHLRAKDRAMNNHTYPKIHYPEVYVLEGGYCNYFKVSGHRCDPPNYVTMDDPNHATARREDLDQFRKAKFGRHKSYAYGDMTAASQQGQSRRNTAPTSLFAAAASAVRARRAGSISLGTLQEDANTTAETERDDTDTDLGDSPCPPPTRAPLLKSKKPLRSLVRSETYNPATRLAF